MSPTIAPTPTPTSMSASEVAKLSTERIMELFAESAAAMASLAGLVCLLGGELERREGFRIDGATSLESWIVARTGVSAPTARAYSQVGERLFDLPHLSDALSAGRVSFDKVRAVAGVATPESDAELAEAAAELSVRDLAELARSARRPGRAETRSEQEARSLRCNDALRTVNAQLPQDAYVEVRNALEARAKQLGSDGETPLGPTPGRRLRLAGALRRASRLRHQVRLRLRLQLRPGLELWLRPRSVSTQAREAHLRRTPSWPTSRSRSSSTRTPSSAASSSAAGWSAPTSYAGWPVTPSSSSPSTTTWATPSTRGARSERPPPPSAARSCAGTGTVASRAVATCSSGSPTTSKSGNATRGTTDIDNLCCLCAYHHHLIHSEGWSMSGDANAELTFVGPSGRVMTSRPSPLWTRVTGPAVRRAAAKGAARTEKGTEKDP